MSSLWVRTSYNIQPHRGGCNPSYISLPNCRSQQRDVHDAKSCVFNCLLPRCLNEYRANLTLAKTCDDFSCQMLLAPSPLLYGLRRVLITSPNTACLVGGPTHEYIYTHFVTWLTRRDAAGGETEATADQRSGTDYYWTLLSSDCTQLAGGSAAVICI